MLEVGKTYKAIQDKEKLIQFEVLKVNKKSYTIMLKDKKETLWINNNGELYLNNPNYSSGWSMTYRPSRFCIEVVDEHEAKLFITNKSLKIHKQRIDSCKAELSDLEQEEVKLQIKKHDLKMNIMAREKEIERLERELKELNND